MAKDKDSEYLIGYKKPPRHTQFKPGQSGNIHGRPKKTPSFAEVLMKELHAPAAMLKINGKPRKISMLQAMLKQLAVQAVKGDTKATALLVKWLTAQAPDAGSQLLELLQEFRTRDAHYVAADESRDQTTTETDLLCVGPNNSPTEIQNGQS